MNVRRKKLKKGVPFSIKVGGFIVAVYAILEIIIWQGCDGSNPLLNYTELSQIVFPPSNVSYSASVQPMFNLGCTFSGCHDDNSVAGGLSLTSYFHANADPGNIVRYNPNQSKLYEVMAGKLPHTGPLDTLKNHITGIYDWILEGAPNN